MRHIVLCSASVNRRKLLEQVGCTIEVEPSYAEESFDPSCHPSKIVEHLASIKMKQERRANTLYISADTIVYYNGIILGKPDDAHEAIDMLKMLSGTYHDVYTGVCIAYNEHIHVFHECTRVWFHTLLKQDIERYVEDGLAFNKAGSYGIQDRGALFVEKIDGDFYTVVGLPLSEIDQRIKEFV